MSKTALVVVAALILVALAGGVVAVILTKVVDWRPSPAGVVVEYLDAIADGDASAANEIFSPEDIAREYLPDELTDTSLMSDDALAGALERIANVRVDSVMTSSGTDGAVVYVSYDIAGERCEDWINLTWHSGEWRMDTGIFQVLKVHAAFDGDAGPGQKALRVLLGDAAADAPFIGIEDAYFIAYPGVYPISLHAPGWIADDDVETPEQIALVTRNKMELVSARYELPE